MSKWKVYTIVGLLLIAGIVAAFFDYPQHANQGIDFLNARAPVSLPHVPELIPFRLGLDLQGGLHLVYEADLSGIGVVEHDSAMAGLRDVLERRVNLFGVTEPLVQTQGDGATRRLIIELAGIQDPNQAIQIIGQTPFLEFREPKENYDEIVANNQKFLETGEGKLEDPFQPTTLTGRYLERAGIAFNQITQEPIITLQFNEEGGKIFEELTGRNIGRPLAIYLDGQLLQAPIVQAQITGGRAQITGRFAVEEAQRISRELNAGALPVPITLISQTSVGPVLGEISLSQSLRAGIAGLFLVMVFITLFYRLPGLIASLALLLYILFVLAVLKLISVTFTLAGIAGLILSVGMAVDANILIFSRMREELRAKKSFGIALEEGFRRAWPSIRDGNITTLLVAFILFWTGSSFVQGFALTLSIGIIMSMISAMFVTRNFLRLFLKTKLEKAMWLWV